MTEKPSDNEDLLFAIAHSLRYDGKKPSRSAEAFMAQVTAQRILLAIQSGWTLTKKPPQPLAPASSLTKMGADRKS